MLFSLRMLWRGKKGERTQRQSCPWITCVQHVCALIGLSSSTETCSHCVSVSCFSWAGGLLRWLSSCRWEQRAQPPLQDWGGNPVREGAAVLQHTVTHRCALIHTAPIALGNPVINQSGSQSTLQAAVGSEWRHLFYFRPKKLDGCSVAGVSFYFFCLQFDGWSHIPVQMWLSLDNGVCEWAKYTVCYQQNGNYRNKLKKV